ncbi:hypothetical protein LTS18_005131, partial [Coniosporium uncinatum]
TISGKDEEEEEEDEEEGDAVKASIRDRRQNAIHRGWQRYCKRYEESLTFLASCNSMGDAFLRQYFPEEHRQTSQAFPIQKPTPYEHPSEALQALLDAVDRFPNLDTLVLTDTRWIHSPRYHQLPTPNPNSSPSPEHQMQLSYNLTTSPLTSLPTLNLAPSPWPSDSLTSTPELTSWPLAEPHWTLVYLALLLPFRQHTPIRKIHTYRIPSPTGYPIWAFSPTRRTESWLCLWLFLPNQLSSAVLDGKFFITLAATALDVNGLDPPVFPRPIPHPGGAGNFLSSYTKPWEVSTCLEHIELTSRGTASVADLSAHMLHRNLKSIVLRNLICCDQSLLIFLSRQRATPQEARGRGCGAEVWARG